mmetsp:Transcript_12875/g.38718  ORF Transcript_12875/g.38718 Transcript_12875/m.38718 type:complete len:86 (+) Transcript_12875:95-352(+)
MTWRPAGREVHWHLATGGVRDFRAAALAHHATTPHTTSVTTVGSSVDHAHVHLYSCSPTTVATVATENGWAPTAMPFTQGCHRPG